MIEPGIRLDSLTLCLRVNVLWLPFWALIIFSLDLYFVSTVLCDSERMRPSMPPCLPKTGSQPPILLNSSPDGGLGTDKARVRLDMCVLTLLHVIQCGLWMPVKVWTFPVVKTWHKITSQNTGWKTEAAEKRQHLSLFEQGALQFCREPCKLGSSPLFIEKPDRQGHF